jgi:hypothetical protein
MQTPDFHETFSFQINWFDQHGNLMNDASYQSRMMHNSSVFEAYSVVSFTPTKDHNNASLRCQVSISTNFGRSFRTIF